MRILLEKEGYDTNFDACYADWEAELPLISQVIYELNTRNFDETQTMLDYLLSGGDINATELCAALINRKDSIPEGIQYAQSVIDGSMSMLVLTPKGLYAARDRVGRTPVILGAKKGAYCAAFESFSYLNLGYDHYKELGPGEIDFITPEGVETVVPARKEMKICTFLWVYYGYPSSCYEGVNVEDMRCRCGDVLAQRDNVEADSV